MGIGCDFVDDVDRIDYGCDRRPCVRGGSGACHRRFGSFG